MQNDFFKKGAGGGPTSSITMTSLGRLSNFKRESNMDIETYTNDGRVGDEVMSTTSGNQGDMASLKVQNFLESHLNKSQSQTKSYTGYRANKINYNNVCDLDRFEKFKTTLQTLASL